MIVIARAASFGLFERAHVVDPERHRGERGVGLALRGLQVALPVDGRAARSSSFASSGKARWRSDSCCDTASE